MTAASSTFLLNLDTSPEEVERVIANLDPELLSEAAALREAFQRVLREAVDLVDRQRALNDALLTLLEPTDTRVDGSGDLQNAVETRLGVVQIRWAFAALNELANGHIGHCYAMTVDDLRRMVDDGGALS